MTCPDSSWKTGLVAPISSWQMKVKRDENGGQPFEKQKPKTQFDGGCWVKKVNNLIYGWNLDYWRALGCSQEPDESDHVSNFGLCMAKLGGIRPPRGVSKNNSTKFWSKLAVFQQTIKYITNIWHVGIQVSYMAGKLLKMRIFGWKKFWVTSYFVGSVNVLLTWYI